MWTGYGGLVKICDDQMFREQGFIREYFPQSPGKDSPGASSAVNSGMMKGYQHVRGERRKDFRTVLKTLAN